jgi:DNA ligase-1
MNHKLCHANILELRSIDKTTEKIKRLKEMLEEDLQFAKILRMALDKTVTYHMTSIPMMPPSRLVTRKPNFAEALLFLDKLSMKNGATNFDREQLGSLVADPDMHALATMIVQKDLKCGVQAKTVNKARPGTVFIMPYQRCSTADKLDNIHWPAIIEVKADGEFVNAVRTKHGVIYRTRPGMLFPLENPDIDEAIMNISSEPFVLQGELRITNISGGEYMPRKRGNGVLNSIAQGNERAAKLYTDKIHYTIWDIIPYDDFFNGYCGIKLVKRKAMLKSVPVHDNNNTSPITKAQVFYPKSQFEAMDLAQEWIENGEEGGVVKNLNSVWKNHTSTDWIKLKEEKVCELRVVGWEPGKKGTKYEDCIGALACESECGQLRVNVSGLTDDERNSDPEEYIGKVISVRFNSVITSKSKDTTSLNLPRVNRDDLGVLEIRPDKDEADTLEYIKSIKNIKEILK